MKRKLLVVATKNWGKCIEDKYIKEAKEIFGDLDVTIDIEYKKLPKPELYKDLEGKNMITEDWFAKYISNDAKSRGYDSSRFRFEVEEGKRWGVESGVRGVNYIDKDNHGEGWIRSAKGLVVRYKDGSKRNQWPKTLCHEEGHELKNIGATKLDIHDYDYKNEINNIEGFYRQFKKPKKNILLGLLQQVLQLLLKQLQARATYPIDKKAFIGGVTQPWLNPSTLYKSGVHNGVDLRAPVGTEVKAPHSGNLYLSGHTKNLGHFCFYECEVDGEMTYHVFPHLMNTPTMQKYKKGEVLGKIGNTGLSIGAHMHWTLLVKKPVSVSHYVSLLDTKDKVIKNTKDPYKWALYHVDRVIL